MILVTGAAGFIGFHVSLELLRRGYCVVGLDNINSYYDIALKEARLNLLKKNEQFHFEKINLACRDEILALFGKYELEGVIHLAAQAGVRYSLVNPYEYVDSNLIGFVNILEGCRAAKVRHLTYASSSSVYGANRKTPFSVHDAVDHPISLYAATKRTNELLAHSYSHLYGIPTTGLRLFTVYGPWGRPDMALFKFVRAILDDQPIDVYNNGQMRRDFTYIDDIVDGILRVYDHPATPAPNFDPLSPDPASAAVPWRIFNLGNGRPVELLRMIEIVEESLGKKAIRHYMPNQPGDMTETHADLTPLTEIIGSLPQTPIEVGIPRFVQWYLDFYQKRGS